MFLKSSVKDIILCIQEATPQPLYGHVSLLHRIGHHNTILRGGHPWLLRENDYLQDTRNRYNDNLNTLYGKIEFVGMSVYKEEATKGVLMEDIYIPLTVIPEKADETDPNITRMNPLFFLEQNACHVILGDPGSGKSTLLRFLSLVGQSKSLQKRYNANPDERLPILITLRRYADELKTRKNLSLIDYIQEVVQTDFNLKSADLQFFEYYLETGQTILLFDGLDELPNPQYKQIIRDQIRTLITTYPGNTTVVTSRIVGYGPPFRFDEKEFSHYRLTRLQLPEIEQFVKDWYKIRVENKRLQEENVKDLMRILQDKDHRAILELAENPLLLTIIVLVHRIDAVLPDERVILYQKCTETLLITWHTWKYPTREVKNRGKIEKQNMRRIEEIAYWMHCQSLGTEKNQRAVVQYEYLKTFLTGYIAESEGPYEESDPGDLAEEFLDFVKKRAGLLIEIGENQYSFVHLTFQEFLASSCILTRGEKEGVKSIWRIIKGNCGDARWHEVIRLLISGLRAYDNQKFLVEKILEEVGRSRDVIHSLLLGGLLLDRIPAAETYRERILYHLLQSASETTENGELRLVLERLRTWIGKQKSNEEVIGEAFKSLWKDRSLWRGFRSIKKKMALLLVVSALNLSETKINELTEDLIYIADDDAELYKLFSCEISDLIPSPSLRRKLEVFWAVEDYFSFELFFSNFTAAAGHAITAALESNLAARRAFEEQLIILFPASVYGPSLEYILNSLEIYLSSASPIYEWARDLVRDRDRDLVRVLDLDLVRDRDLDRDRAQDLIRDLVRDLDRVLARDLDRARVLARAQDLIRVRDLVRAQDLIRVLDLDRVRDRALDLIRDLVRDLIRDLVRDRVRDLDLDRVRDRALYLALYLARDLSHKQDTKIHIWPFILATSKLYSFILDFFCDIFKLEPRPQWWEALRVRFLPAVPQRVTLYDESLWKKIETAFEKNEEGETEIYIAAWLLIFDAWLYIYGYYQSKDESIFTHLADITREIDAPPLRIAHCIRDLAYGDESRTDDLVSMVKSDDPAYREIFEATYWRPKSK